ncbi:hypothetical protein GE061_003307 [Apolygus lucorum]|uniref:Purine nucleoside phosphorylase n=1 Tax=Apolygus lucorum TaxID=248454 RepID=A0A8S9X144_APOLU|nr:hypothetical protein GE061_003307 [Apolygus lucorum]
MDTKVINGNRSRPDHPPGCFEVVKGVADWLLSRTDVRPRIGMICGTGMGSVPGMINVRNEFAFEDIPHFPVSTVKGHAGKLILGFIGSVPVMCMKGRAHYYEGYDIAQCVLPVRVMKECGVTHMMISNAAGALNENFQVGDVMIMKDHVNFLGLAGVNPLRGISDDRFGPRFLLTSRIYDKEMRQMAKQAAKELGYESQFHEGVFAMVGGPNFETVAECRMLRMMGIDTVGMSTAHEALAGHHCGIKVFAFSIVTNKCDMEYDSGYHISHDQILASGFRMELMIRMWISTIISLLSAELEKTKS